MEIRQLRYFVAVAEAGHFGQAAEQLHIAQGAVSKQIAGLERELGLTLFDRSRRRIGLTPDGEAFLPHARRALRGVERAARAAADLAAGRAGVLRLGSQPGLGRRLEQVLAEFRTDHPDVRISLTTTRSAPGKIAAVLGGDLDASFVTAPPRQTGLAAYRLWDEPMVLAVPVGRVEGAARLTALADLPLARAAREENPQAFDLLTRACEAAGFVPKAGPTVVNAEDVLLGPVAAGECWALLPAHAARSASGAVALVEPAEPILLPTALVLPRPARRALAGALLAAARRVSAPAE